MSTLFSQTFLVGIFLFAWVSGSVAAESTEQATSQIAERLLAVQKAPENARARLELGMAYSNEGEFELAMAELVEAIRLNPDNTDNIAGQANFYIGLALAALDRPTLAVNSFKEALRLGWNDPHVFTAIGQSLNSQGKFEEASTQFREALTRSPELYEARLGLAIALESAGQVDEAMRQYEIALQHAPQDDAHAVEVIQARLSKLKQRQKM